MARDAKNLLWDEVPDLTEYQVIGMNIQSLGSSFFSLRIPGCDKVLRAQLPSKFNKLVFFGKNKFCVATLPYTRAELGIEAGGKKIDIDVEEVLAVIDTILTEKNISSLAARNAWPEEFTSFVPAVTKREVDPDNPKPESNRKQCVIVESSSSEMYY